MNCHFDFLPLIFDFSWDEYIESFEHEQEVIIENLKFKSNLIKNIQFFREQQNSELIKLMNTLNLNFKTF